jgi:hypothetical protein
MINSIRRALAARHIAVVEAEAMVATHDWAALHTALELAADPHVPYDERLHHERVVTIALKRKRGLELADRRTKDEIIERWTWRRGSRVRH